MPLNSLAFRIFITAVGWALLVLSLTGFLIYSIHREGWRLAFEDRIETLVRGIAFDSLENGKDPLTPVNRFEPLFEQTNSGWYWQIKPLESLQGKRLVSASLATGSLPSPFEQGQPLASPELRWTTATGPDGETILIGEIVQNLGYIATGPKYSVAVAGPLTWVEGPTQGFLGRLAAALGAAGAGLIALTLFQVQFGLAPLRKIERGLAAIRSGDATTLEGELPAEIAPLQAELNALIQFNQDLVDRARKHAGNLAHALKTPLAVITNEARSHNSAFAAKVAEQAAIMRSQVAHHLDRARIAARSTVIGRVTPVEPIVSALVRTLEKIYEEKKLRFTVSCPPGLRFQGEQQDLEEILGNLLDNACKWAKGEVQVSLHVLPDVRGETRRFAVNIEDDGPGLPPEKRAQLGQRGFRLDETKPGSGLGLSIVADLVQSYQGAFSLDTGRWQGLLARLILPAT